MKAYFPLILILLIACGPLSEKKNIQLKWNGLTSTNDYLKVDNVISKETEFVIGSQITYLLEGVGGFSIKDDRALFGASMTVIDQANGAMVLQYDDLFAERVEGYSKQDASVLNFTLDIGSPMKVGSNYTWSIRVWDKRGTGELTAEMPFLVTEGKDLVSINTQPNGLKPGKVFILSNGSLKSTDVVVGQKLTLYCENIHGLAIQPDSTVSIGASMVVVDKTGNKALEYVDVFQQNPVMPFLKSQSITLYLIVGDPMKAGETYLWKMRLWDKNNNNFMESSISINVKGLE
jgi:hypothetical protein